MTKPYTFLFISFSVLILSCSNPKEAYNKDVTTISTNSKQDSLHVDKTMLSGQIPNKPENLEKVKSKLNLNGIWIAEEDNKAFISIKENSWVSGYEGLEVTEDYKYNLTIVDKLPQFVDPKVKSEFFILTNKTDTLYYELNGLTNENLSLTDYPNMDTQVYKRKK